MSRLSFEFRNSFKWLVAPRFPIASILTRASFLIWKTFYGMRPVCTHKWAEEHSSNDSWMFIFYFHLELFNYQLIIIVCWQHFFFSGFSLNVDLPSQSPLCYSFPLYGRFAWNSTTLSKLFTLFTMSINAWYI